MLHYWHLHWKTIISGFKTAEYNFAEKEKKSFKRQTST